MSSTDKAEPSQLNGQVRASRVARSVAQLKSAQGSAYEAVGSLTGSESWKTSGAQLRTEGDAEVRMHESSDIDVR